MAPDIQIVQFNIPQDKEFYKSDYSELMPQRIAGGHPGKIAKNKCRKSYYSNKIDICTGPVEFTKCQAIAAF